MSLAELPDELIAHVTSYLDYDDIRNLMETSQKNYNAIKYYGKDRLTIGYLHIDKSTATGKGIYRDKTFEFNGHDDNKMHESGKTKVDRILHMVDACWSIDDVRCDRIDDDFCKAMIQTGTEIRSVRNIRGSVTASPTLFIALCEKMKTVYMKYPYMRSDEMCDEVFIKCKDSMFLEYETEDYNVSLGLTDRTLEAYAEKKQHFIELNGVLTSFTVEGIVKAIQVMRESGKGMFWLLGVLVPRQREAAEFYFNKETGRLRNEFGIQSEYDDYFHRTCYNLTNPVGQENEGNSSGIYIKFEVSGR